VQRRVVVTVVAACSWAASAQAGLPDGVPPSDGWVAIATDELRADFDVLWAVSDVHGRLEELDTLLLAAHLATRDAGNRVVWNPGQRRQLFVADGDYIDGGRESAGVVLRFAGLREQAAAAGSRVVALIGNHDAAFLADPRSADRRLLSSAHRAAAELGVSSRPTPEDLSNGEFGRFLRSLPAAAFIGSWLFAHSGYLDAPDDDARKYLTAVAQSWSHGDSDRYRALLDPRSIVDCHDWWKSRKRRERMKVRLSQLGLNGIVFGHDPDALGFPRTIAMDPDGWLIKLDTGLKTASSRGMLLRCDTSRIVQGTRLVMSVDGKPTCQVFTPAGVLEEIPR
jgi:hypothetical protein